MIDPEWVTEISRWLSVATPPERDQQELDPGGVAERIGATHPGSNEIDGHKPVVSLRSTTG